MQARARPEQPTTPRSLRFDTSSARRPSDATDKPPKAPPATLRLPQDGQTTSHRTQRSNTTNETSLLHAHSPGLERAATSPGSNSHKHTPSTSGGLFKTLSQETWPLRKSSDEPRPYEDSFSRTRDNPLPTLSHDDILTPMSARDHAVEDTSPLPTTPRLRDSTFMPDHRKLKWAHPDSGKFKPRPSPSKDFRNNAGVEKAMVEPEPSPAAATAPALPVPTEHFNFALRDSVKSSTTYVSSVNEISATERSSTMTSRTSASEMLSPYHTTFSRPSLDEEMSVDDYIALYANGFEDDPPPRTESLAPPLPNKPAVSSPLSPRREERVPPVPKIAIPPTSKKTFPEIARTAEGGGRETSIMNEKSATPQPHPTVSGLASARRRSGSSTLASTSSPSPLPSSTPSFLSSSNASMLSSSNPSLLPNPPHSATNGRVTSAQLFAGEIPPDHADLSFLEPPPDPNSDRYGFKKDNQYISTQQYDEWDAQYRIYLARPPREMDRTHETTQPQHRQSHRIPAPL